MAVIGDKIDYLWMIELINNLKTNIEFQITRITAEVNTNVNVNSNVDLNQNQNQQSNLITINILKSLHQRFDVLKAITDSLYNIVNFSFKIEMLKLSRFSSPTNMEQFKTFLDNQLASLNIMLTNLNTQFPKKQAELQLQKKQTEEEIEIEAFEQEIKNLRQNATDIAIQRGAEMTSRHNTNWWIAVETVTQSWVNIGLNTTEIIRKNIGLAVASLSNIGLEIPYAVFSSILQYLDKVLIELLFSPLGFVLIIGGLLSTVFMFGGISGTIRIFKKGGEFFVAVFWGGILFIYKLIKTPFGYIFKQIATMRVTDTTTNNNLAIDNAPFNNQTPDEYGQYGKSNYDAFLSGREEDEEYDPTNTYSITNKNYIKNGGKRHKKQKKTRKHKKKRTRKLNKHKKRQTKHKRNKQSKKR